jgi:hypothetical protein
MATYHSGAAASPYPNQSEGKIRCSHLLVKHKDSRRPSSWREAEITRTKDEAREILRGHQERILQGEARLGDLAMSESDCSSARKKGDLYVYTCYPVDFPLLSCSIITNSSKVASSGTVKCRKSLRTQHSLCNRVKSVTLLSQDLAFILSSGMSTPTLADLTTNCMALNTVGCNKLFLGYRYIIYRAKLPSKQMKAIEILYTLILLSGPPFQFWRQLSLIVDTGLHLPAHPQKTGSMDKPSFCLNFHCYAMKDRRLTLSL